MATCFFRRARVYNVRAESDRLTEAERQQLVGKAREMLQQALTSYGNARETLKSVISNFQIDPQDPDSEKTLMSLRDAYTKTRVRMPMVTEQIGDTYQAGDPNREKFLSEAADQYADLFEKYRRFPAGLDAALFCARCREKIGKYDDALMILEELFELDNTSALRVLKRKAILVGTRCWSNKDPYPHDEVIRHSEPIISTLSRQELRHPEWLAIQLELARAYRSKAEAVGKESGSGVAGRVQDLNRTAAQLARNVSRVPSDYRDAAKQLLADWNLKVNEIETANKQLPMSFSEARQKGQDYVVEIESLLEEIKTLKDELAKANAADQADLQDQLNDANGQLKSQIDLALEAFEMALSLRDADTQREDINKIRYLQSFCYFANKQFYESALIGEFLLDYYPSVNWSKQAAALAVKSYAVMQYEASEENKPAETDRLKQFAARVVDRYPGSPESAVAAGRIVRIALADKDFETAEQFVEQIPPDNPSHGSLSASLGNKLWFQHVATKAELEPAAQQAQMDKAIQYLSAALKSATIDRLDYDTALAALLLVDAQLSSGNTDAAVQQLESATIAPLDLIKQKHPAVTGNPAEAVYKRETFKTAIKAYLAAMRNSEDQQKWIAKTRGVIDAMRADLASSDDPDDRKRLSSIYRLIARQLSAEFESLTSAEEKKIFANTLSTFMGAIEKDSQEAKTVLWAGSTLMDVAGRLAQDESLADDAKPIFQQAISALDTAEQLGFADDDEGQALKIELRRQRALANRGTGNYEQAVEQFTEILKENQLRLGVQLDAAETLQAWAKATKRANGYIEAMMGREPVVDKKTRRKSNVIWGWRNLVRRTRNQPQYADQFYQSLYRLIEARLEYGLLAESEKAIAAAQKELDNARQRDPALGGETWKPKFDALEKRIKNSK